jgi:phospholipid transport system substrate-binding protein
MNKQVKFYVLLVTFVFLLIGVVLAEPQTTPVSTADQAAIPATPEDPVKMLQDVSNNVLQALRTRKDHSDIKGVYSLVDKYILPYADFDEMSQWVAGRKIWSKASEQTKQAFMDAFKVLVVRTYATALNSYTNEKVDFGKQKLDLNKDRIQVTSTIVRTDAKKENIRVDYRLLKKDNKWYVYDIIIEGVSILQGFQAQFSNEIKQKGLEKVTAQIQQHNRETNV